MGDTSKISWCDHTFNLWWGCEHASRDNPNGIDADPAATSPECDNCYAETFDHRVGGKHWGPGAEPRFFGDEYWAKPLRWNAAAQAAGERARVFCASMADWAQHHADPQINVRLRAERARLFKLIQRTTWLDWLLLTKRAENLGEFLPWMLDRRLDAVAMKRLGIDGPDSPALKPWRNVWVGVTCGARSSLWRIAELHKIRAAVRFVSAEPLLDHISASEWDVALAPRISYAGDSSISWLIIGDESGPNRRPAQVDWIRTAREAAQRNGVAFHFKQWAGADVNGISGARKGKNGKIHLPILDGKSHAAFPEVRRG